MTKRVGYIAFASAMALILAFAIPAAGSSTKALSGSVPPWATSKNYRSHTSSSTDVGFRVYLGWRDASSAEAVARAVSDPRSSSYGKYLSPAQFRQRFAPSQSSVNAVKQWLHSAGFSLVYTPSNNLYVSAEGTASQVEKAFSTTLNNYRYKGLTLRAPSSSLRVPSSLGSTVTSVLGIDQVAQLVHYDHPDAPPGGAFVNAPPCSAYWNEKTATGMPEAYGQTSFPYVECGRTPAQLRGAYGIDGLNLDGSGQTVAIIDAYASPTILQDANEYSSRHGLPTFKAHQFSQIVSPGTYRHPERGQKQDPQGWYGEETLDVESVHTMAPGANVVYVGAPNNFQDLDAALNLVVDRHVAQIVTNSYGNVTEDLPRGWIKPYESIIVQAAAEGIGVYFSSGDDGDETESNADGVRTVDWPASSPFVTAVGGTSLANGPDNSYLFETGWGTRRAILTDNAWNPTPPGTFLYASGGGTSRLFAQPAYQAGVVPDSLADYFGTGHKWRVVPDVALDGDPNTGMLIGQTQTFPDGSTKYNEYRLGGTSLSSPLFAGIMALADQAAGHAHGFANPAIYALPDSAFRDIVNPPTTLAVVRVDYINSVDASDGLRTSLRTMNETESLHTIPGYDDVTGRGTPNGGAFVNHV